MRNGIKVLSAALALAASGLAVGLGPGVAGAQTDTTLPITSFHQMVADPASGDVFISDPDQNEILVARMSGQEVKVIGSQDGVMGLALSSDGSTLYAALGAGDAVTAISVSALKQIASYPLPTGDAPFGVAVQSGEVWVSYSIETTAEGAIGDIDVAASSPAFAAQPNMGGWSAAPEVAADPDDSGVLVAAEPGTSPSSVASYNVSIDPATVYAQDQNAFDNCDNEGDLAVVPGGADFILACAVPQGTEDVYSTADLSQEGSYASTFFPDAVAVDASGDVAAGSEGGLTSTPDIYVYQQNAGTPASTFNLNSAGGSLPPGGLAWTPDGSQLFAVMSFTNDVGGGTTYTLQAFPYPALIQSALTLSGPSTAGVAKPVTLTGSLTIAGSPAPAGTAVMISRSEADSTTVKDFTVTTASDGSFSLTDRPPRTGQYRYTAGYSGSATVAPATASQTIIVTGKPTSLGVTASPTRATYEPTVHVTAHLGTTSSSRTLSIYAETSGSTSERLLKTGKVNSSGNLTVSYRAAHSTTFTARFAGDTDYAPATATESVFVRAKVSESLSGYDRTKRTGGHAYRLFHRKKIMHIHVAVAPNKRGECVEFTLEVYSQGHWHSGLTRCGTLSKSSTLAVGVSLTKFSLRYHYRIRADYVPGIDSSNLGNHSAWAYFIVEK